MAVIIRLRRAGNRNNAYFHVVATDSRSPRDGRFLERLGHYDPRAQPAQFKIDRPRLEHWLSNGATTSPTVAQLLSKQDKQVAGEG